MFPIIGVAISALSTMAATIWPAVQTFIQSTGAKVLPLIGQVITKVGPYIDKLKEFVNVACKVIEPISKALNLLAPNEQIHDFGEKVIQAEEQGVTQEKFKNYKEYKQYLDDFKVDESKRHSELERGIAGAFVTLREICNIAPQLNPEELVAVLDKKSGFILKNIVPRMEIYSKFIKDGKLPVDGWLALYREGNIPPTVILSLQDVEKELKPGISTFEAAANLNQLRQEFEDTKK